MAETTPYGQSRELANQLGGILRTVDRDELSREAGRLLESVLRYAQDARLEIRDYEYADTVAEQRKSATKAVKLLEKLQATILKASEYDLFGPVDVALTTANIQQIISDING